MAKESSMPFFGLVSSLVVVLLCTPLLTTPANAAVGRTAGSFNVDATGAASYTIPIFTPPGPRGVQPGIVLVYNSNGGVGYLGRGWSLAGFSSIQRCARTIAEDGATAAVALQVSDGYCLDGNRLRLQGGSYGYGGSTWATEIADFSYITANGTAGNGPASWTVQRKDGLTYTYGGTADSQVLATGTTTASRWMVSQISDRAGNKVRFTWKSADSTTSGTTHPVKIEWTQTSAGSGSYLYSMDFLYGAGANAPASSYYANVSGTDVKETDLLTGITVSVNSVVRRNYVLTYENSPTTAVKRLAQVLECADSAASDCLAPTAIQYQDGVVGVDTGGTPALNLSGSYASANGRYDFNGDGVKDLAYQRSGAWYVRLGSTSGGYGGEISTGLTTLRAGRLRADGRDHLLGLSGSTWYVYTWDGSGFSPTSTGITTSASSTDIVVADADGDGRDDLVYSTGVSMGMAGPFPVANISLGIRRNVSTGSGLSFAGAVSSQVQPVVRPNVNPSDYPLSVFSMQEMSATFARGGDLNADKRQELSAQILFMWCETPPPWAGPPVCGYQQTNQILVATGTLSYAQSGMTWIQQTGITPLGIDLNRDGCDDYQYSDGTTTNVLISDCGNNVATTITQSMMGGTLIGLADWDGDGLKDFLVWPSGASTLYVRRLLGAGATAALGTLQDTGISISGIYTAFATDGNGDGQDEIGYWTGAALKVYWHSGTRPDLAAHFTDGYGVTYSPGYGSITGSLYTPYSNATYPYQDVKGGRTAVGSFTASDGIGGTYTTTYHYYGGVENLGGLGFAGFDKIEATDSRYTAIYGAGNGVIHQQLFRRDWPYTGSLSGDNLIRANGELLHTQSQTYSSQTLDSTPHNERYFIYPYFTSEYDYALSEGGTQDGTVTESLYSFDASSQGNPLSIVTTNSRMAGSGGSFYPDTSTSWTTTTAYTYGSYSTNWCVLPTSTTVTHQGPSLSNIVQYKTFTPDYGNCRISADDVEPGNTPRRVHTDYGYDAFGNVSSTSVTGYNAGSAMTARTTSTNYGTTGQFPVSETDAMGKTTNRAFDPTFGSLASEVDPNNIEVVHNYFDTFGNISRTNRGDGTGTVFWRYDCVAYVWCENGDPGSGITGINKLVVIASERDASNNQISASSANFDQFDRTIVQYSTPISGGLTRIGRQYDVFGRLYRETAPCDYYSCAVYWKTNSYDLLGRLTQQTRPRKDSGSEAVTTTIAYSGLTQTVTDAEGKNSVKTVDANGRLAFSTDHDGYSQWFVYDAAGSLTSVWDLYCMYWISYNTCIPIRVPFSANYSYGIQAFQDSSSDVDLGGRTYTHDSLGELLSWTDSNGPGGATRNFSQSYDPLSRVTSRTEPEGTSYFNYGASQASHNIGRLASVSMTANSYSEALSYDGAGRPSTRSITADGQTYNIGYAYNDQGQLDILTYPANPFGAPIKVKYGYAYGLLQSVTDWTSGSAGTVYWTANTQNVRGQTTQETLGNNVVTTRSFDAVTGWLNSLQSASGSTSLQNQSYAYDRVGNLWQRQENTLGLTENFYYDNLHRLSYSQLNGITNLTLSYDVFGDISARSDVNGGAAWSYDATHVHAVTSTGAGGASYSYDANGNRTSGNGATISWASYNYPTDITTSSESTHFAYGPDRQYYRQDYSGPSTSETTYYIGGILEKVSSGGTTDWRHYISAGGQTVAIVSRTSGGATVSYPLEDNQGSGSTLTNGSGSLLARESFSAFGLPRDGNDWDGSVPSGDQTTINGISRRGYTGHSMLGSMGLIHMNGRVMDATIGRFLSPDPTNLNPGFTQSYNRYSYVYNNPLSYIDPSGFVGLPDGVLDPALVTGTRVVKTQSDEDLLRLSALCIVSIAYMQNCDEAWQRLQIWQAQLFAQQEAANREKAFNLAQSLLALPGRLFKSTLKGVFGWIDCGSRECTTKEEAKELGTAAVTILTAAIPELKFAKGMGSAAEEGGLVIGKMEDLAQETGWRNGDYALYLPKLPAGAERWAQNERELLNAMSTGKPIRDVSPTGAGGFLDRERKLLFENGWRFDETTRTWSPGP